MYLKWFNDLNAFNDGGELESKYYNSSPEKLKLNKEKIDKNETSFFDLHMKIRNINF